MTQEPNLFGELQERNPPVMLRVRFEVEDESGVSCSGYCLLEPHQLKEKNNIKIRVIEWEEEPEWDMEELNECSKEEFWLSPAYECELAPCP